MHGKGCTQRERERESVAERVHSSHKGLSSGASSIKLNGELLREIEWKKSETNRTYKLHKLDKAIDTEVTVAILAYQNVGRVHLLYLRLDFHCEIEDFPIRNNPML